MVDYLHYRDPHYVILANIYAIKQFQNIPLSGEPATDDTANISAVLGYALSTENLQLKQLC